MGWAAHGASIWGEWQLGGVAGCCSCMQRGCGGMRRAGSPAPYFLLPSRLVMTLQQLRMQASLSRGLCACVRADTHRQGAMCIWCGCCGAATADPPYSAGAWAKLR